MSDTYNLAGKKLVVDSIEEVGKSTSSLQSIRSAYDTAKAKLAQKLTDEAIASANGYTDTSVGNLNTSVTSVLRRVGARKVMRSSVLQIDMFCYNPRKDYHYFDDTDPDPLQYQGDYYDSSGFVRCDGMNIPVYIPSRYTTFTPATHGGVWVLAIYKANALDEAYTPIVLHPYANGQVMEWRKTDNTAISSALLLNTWIIGSFKVTLSGGSVSKISELFVSQEGVTPESFKKKTFMQMMNDADSTVNFNDWAIAMGCDQIFERLAVLEMFVDKLFANSISINSGGHIQSNVYSPSSEEITCVVTDSEFSSSGIEASVNGTTFVSEVGSGSYGVYKFVCIASGAYGGNWELYKDNVSQGTVSYSDMSGDYGVSASYDFPDITSVVDDYIEVTYQRQTIAGEGFYLGADGTFKGYSADLEDATMKNATINKATITDASVSGAVTASTFKFDNVSMTWRHYNITSSPFVIDFGMDHWGDFVIVSWGGFATDYPTASKTFSFILSDGVRGLVANETLISESGTTFTYARSYGGAQLGLVITGANGCEVVIQIVKTIS